MTTQHIIMVVVILDLLRKYQSKIVHLSLCLMPKKFKYVLKFLITAICKRRAKIRKIFSRDIASGDHKHQTM